jgi:hypothetical protein
MHIEALVTWNLRQEDLEYALKQAQVRSVALKILRSKINYHPLGKRALAAFIQCRPSIKVNLGR